MRIFKEIIFSKEDLLYLLRGHVVHYKLAEDCTESELREAKIIPKINSSADFCIIIEIPKL